LPAKVFDKTRFGPTLMAQVEHRPVSNRPEPDCAWIHTELQRRLY
jgi:hypothetical protein